MSYILRKKNSRTHARLGILRTKNGRINTPFFLPVATQGAIKFLGTNTLDRLGAQAVLSNTYHLMLQPGSRLIQQMGGLHRFMNWGKPILTDSGGFQVFSLGNMRKVHDTGVDFRDDRTGNLYTLTPKKAIQTQSELGVDIMMALDECPASTLPKKEISDAVRRTTHWAKESKKAFQKLYKYKRKRPLLFGIIQGGLDPDLRKKSLQDLVDIGFDGYAIGGLAVGESNDEMYNILESLVSYMPQDKPRYLMGVGKPENIIKAVSMGVDMFDCVLPTRNARHGQLYTKPKLRNVSNMTYKLLRITNARFKKDKEPLDPTCDSECCSLYSRAYVHHLFKADEPLGKQIATVHNLRFYFRMMKQIRKQI